MARLERRRGARAGAARALRGRAPLAEHGHRQRARPHGLPAAPGPRGGRAPAAARGGGRPRARRARSGASPCARARRKASSPRSGWSTPPAWRRTPIAGLAGIDVDAAGYRQHYWKGSYFSVRPAKASVVSRLVYPVPGHVSLGVHAVVGLEGRLRFGPDAEYLPDRALDYRGGREQARRLRDLRAAAGARASQDEDLEPDMAGIRPKLQGPGRASATS